MAQMDNDVDRAIAALQAVQLARDSYGSGVEGCRRVKDICEMLAMGDAGHGQFGGLRKTVAEAISRAYLNADLKDVQFPPV